MCRNVDTNLLLVGNIIKGDRACVIIHETQRITTNLLNYFWCIPISCVQDTGSIAQEP